MRSQNGNCRLQRGFVRYVEVEAVHGTRKESIRQRKSFPRHNTTEYVVSIGIFFRESLANRLVENGHLLTYARISDQSQI